MKFSKFIVIPVIIAALACVLQIVDQLLAGTHWFITDSGFGWVSFQAWALYFLAGCTIPGAVRVFLGYVSGAVASILIMLFGGWLAGHGLGFWAMPLSLLILVIPVICLERVRWFDMVPAIFIGAGAFFALRTYVEGVTFCGTACTLLTFCVIGLVFGWVTVSLRTAYEKCLAKKE